MITGKNIHDNGEQMSKKYIFNIGESQKIKGMLILFLLFHHLFYLSGWLEEYSVVIGCPGMNYNSFGNFAKYFRICVGGFALLTGYGMGRKFASNEELGKKELFYLCFSNL